MNKIIIEDNIPLPSINDGCKTDADYTTNCLMAMAIMEIGQSFLIYRRSESSVKGWIEIVSRRSGINYHNNPDKCTYIHGINIKDKQLKFQYETITTEKQTTKIHSGKECKQYPVRVWRIK